MIIRALAAGIASASFSVLFQVRGRNIILAGMNGGIGYFVYLLMGSRGDFLSLLLASGAMTLCSEVTARIKHSPATLFLVPGLIPIVPGGGIYNCVLEALEGNIGEAVLTCYTTLLEAGAIAVGIIVASSLLKLISVKKP